MANLSSPSRLSDEKHVARLRQLAERRKISGSKIIAELSTVALAEFDTETRFRALASPLSLSQRPTAMMLRAMRWAGPDGSFPEKGPTRLAGRLIEFHALR